jgi:hypothetical protein
MRRSALRYFLRVLIISAAIAPGIQPARVSSSTSNTDPQPLSNIDKGGNKMHKSTRQIDIRF